MAFVHHPADIIENEAEVLEVNEHRQISCYGKAEYPFLIRLPLPINGNPHDIIEQYRSDNQNRVLLLAPEIKYERSNEQDEVLHHYIFPEQEIDKQDDRQEIKKKGSGAKNQDL